MQINLPAGNKKMQFNVYILAGSLAFLKFNDHQNVQYAIASSQSPLTS